MPGGLGHVHYANTWPKRISLSSDLKQPQSPKKLAGQQNSSAQLTNHCKPHRKAFKRGGGGEEAEEEEEEILI